MHAHIHRRMQMYIIFTYRKKMTLTDLHTHHFLTSLAQPAAWFDFLMSPIEIIISFLLIYPAFTDTLQTFKSIWNELANLEFAGLMNFDKIQILCFDSTCAVLYKDSGFAIKHRKRHKHTFHWKSSDLHQIQTGIQYIGSTGCSYCQSITFYFTSLLIITPSLEKRKILL